MSAYYATPGGIPTTASGEQMLAPVLATFAGPAPQSRLTVFFRFFMAIPQFFVLFFLTIAAYVIAIIGWFCALCIGRLPDFAADFLTGYLRWQARVTAYSVLLTDVYPPFSLGDADYPVRIAVMPGRLNRLAVLFRFFLLIPCGIVQSVVSYGALAVFQVVSWLIVLIKGQMPVSIHQALAAVLRYQFRTAGFGLMLTSAYPAGLFGDPEVPGPSSPAGPPLGDSMGGQFGQPQPGYGAQPGYGDPQAGYGTQPGYEDPQAEYGDPQAGYGTQPGYGDPQAGYGTQPGYGEAQPGQGAQGYGGLPSYSGSTNEYGQQMGPEFYGAQGLSWRLVLSGTARKLVVFFIVLGVVFIVFQSAFQATVAHHTVSEESASIQVQSDVNPVSSALNNYSTKVLACKGSLTCVTTIDSKLAATLNTFAAQLPAIPMPSGQASADAQALSVAVSQSAAKFTKISTATSPTQYLSFVNAAGLQASIDKINTAFTKLGTDLGA